jgi:signal transduction histidine kinase
MLRAARAFHELRENQERLIAALDELRENQERLIAARDAAEAANKAKSEFLANMGHELRTPLNAIIGFASIMHEGVRGPLDSVYVEDAKIIVDSGMHLLAVINDILDIARAESHLLNLAEDMVDIAEIVRSSAAMVTEWARQGQVACAYDLEPGLPAVWADGKKLQQIISNLLSNAVKFTPAGGRMTLSARREANGSLAICIADTGIGIAPEQIAVALAPFGQVDGSITRKYEGVGLGLPLAKRLVELHDGVLEIDSTLGKGTTVTIRLPAKRLMGDRAAA